jgi:N-methylhydantoinase A
MTSGGIRIACDIGGTFSDIMVEAEARLGMRKALSTPEDPIRGVLSALDLAAVDLAMSRQELLARTETFIHGTTRAINAILTGTTARTAFLTTAGHPDILVLREGGRLDPFDFTVPFPEPYVPRALTFEVPERIDAAGRVIRPLDEAAARSVIGDLAEHKVEAVAVSLLWAIANPTHELLLGDLLTRHLPEVPFTLSHRLNPIVREYRRASATCIDASLKPLMSAYLEQLDDRLRAEGFVGRVLVVTSSGTMMDAADVAEAPIQAVNSGPAMAPVAGAHFAAAAGAGETAIVADAGGTSFDVSLVRRGDIPRTRETWLGPRFRGHMSGFPSVDVRSIGAGGGSIAWVDEGGLLHVGPASAGAMPGPACYGRGGTAATVTDAALVLGYLDPGFFLGGALQLDLAAAWCAIADGVADPLKLPLDAAAAAVLAIATESMVGAIAEITIAQGIDPADAVLIGGGGAAGLNAVAIARRLGCARVVIPELGAALSAAGALLSDLGTEFGRLGLTTTRDFDFDRINRLLDEMAEAATGFISGAGRGSLAAQVTFSVEARYPHQTWEVEVPLAGAPIRTAADVRRLTETFHASHRELFEIDEPGSAVEFVTWRARARCRLREGPLPRLPHTPEGARRATVRRVYFSELQWVEAAVRRFEAMTEDDEIAGPAIIESAFTTVVVEPGALARRSAGGSLLITV